MRIQVIRKSKSSVVNILSTLRSFGVRLFGAVSNLRQYKLSAKFKVQIYIYAFTIDHFLCVMLGDDGKCHLFSEFRNKSVIALLCCRAELVCED